MPVTSTFTDKSADALKAMRTAIAGGMGDYGREVKEELRGLIGTPFPPASAPGTPPHTRTGLLEAGIDVQQENSPTDSTLAVSSSRGEKPMVPTWLEKGTRKMAPRPYMGPMMQAVGASGPNRLAGHIAARFGK